MKFEININDAAEVVLSEYGAKVYNEWCSQFRHYRPELKNPGDTYRDQLWSLMQIFGPAIHLGQHSPFEDARLVFEKGGR